MSIAQIIFRLLVRPSQYDPLAFWVYDSLLATRSAPLRQVPTQVDLVQARFIGQYADIWRPSFGYLAARAQRREL